MRFLILSETVISPLIRFVILTLFPKTIRKNYISFYSIPIFKCSTFSASTKVGHVQTYRGIRLGGEGLGILARRWNRPGITAVLKFRDVSNSCSTFKRKYNFCYLQLAWCAPRDAAKYKIIKGHDERELWPLRRNSLALTRLQLLTA